MTAEKIAVAAHEHVIEAAKPKPALGLFERYLSVWVALCIVAGIALGNWFPAPFQAIGRAEVAQVNLPVAVLIWLMIIPMLLKIDVAALHQVKDHWRGIGVTLFINWAVKPFSMALLGWLFVGLLFRPWLPANQIDSYIAGLIILAAAPCTAMVFVWSNLCDGEPHFTLSQVALNDTIMVFAFAPIVGLLLGLSSIVVPWETLVHLGGDVYRHPGDRSPGVAPGAVATTARRARKHAEAPAAGLADCAARNPGSAVRFSGRANPGAAADHPDAGGADPDPGLLQLGFRLPAQPQLGVAHCVAAPSALIGASNFFELAVATAIVLFGFNSGAALATVVGVLVEVPVMLSVVRITNATRNWYERAA